MAGDNCSALARTIRATRDMGLGVKAASDLCRLWRLERSVVQGIDEEVRAGSVAEIRDRDRDLYLRDDEEEMGRLLTGVVEERQA